VDYGCPSAVHILADIVTSLTKLQIPSQPRSSLNVGVISGGTSVNTVAAEAHLELDLRSESAEVLQELTQQVQAIVDLARQSDAQISIETIGRRPAGEIPRDHPLVQLAIDTLNELGVQPNLTIGSTDANIPLSQGLPSICVGLTTGYGAHTVNEYIYTEPVARGMTQLVHLVEGIFRLGENSI
jgi:di/tripeptidase